MDRGTEIHVDPWQVRLQADDVIQVPSPLADVTRLLPAGIRDVFGKRKPLQGETLLSLDGEDEDVLFDITFLVVLEELLGDVRMDDIVLMVPKRDPVTT